MPLAATSVLTPYRLRPRRLRQPRLVIGTVPTFLCSPVLKCHALYAGGSPGALGQCFPDVFGLRLSTQARLPQRPHKRFHVGACFDMAGIP
jgi:hypothetical protein